MISPYNVTPRLLGLSGSGEACADRCEAQTITAFRDAGIMGAGGSQAHPKQVVFG